MRKTAKKMWGGAIVFATLVMCGCSSVSPQDPESAGGAPMTAVEQAESEPALARDALPADGADAQWVMPNVVGSVLQDAQDQVQAVTGSVVFYTASHDLTGASRNQLVDSNWRVCTQNIAPGGSLEAETELDFGVVKLDEVCP